MGNSFENLNQDGKIDFFVKCQELMLKHHPNSHLIVRENELSKVLDVFQNNIQKYRGYYHQDENVCVLWNHIVVHDPHDVQRVIKENAYQPPNPDFNAVSIDFAVFRKMQDCLNFVKANNNNLIQYVLFIRDGKPKIYPIDALLKAADIAA